MTSDLQAIPPHVIELVDASFDAAVVLDSTLTLVHWNRAFVALTKVKRRDLLERTWRGVCHDILYMESCADGCVSGRALRSGLPVRVDEVRSTTRPELRLIVTAVPIGPPDDRLIVESYRDVSAESRMQERYRELLENERRQTEILQAVVKKRTGELTRSFEELNATRAQLIQSEKMSSIGQLVAGIAHELNNPVNFIYGNMDFLEDHVRRVVGLLDEVEALDLAPEQRARFDARAKELDIAFVRQDLTKLLKAVRSGAERVSAIIRDLRVFSHGGETNHKDFDLNEGIETALNLIMSKAKDRVTVLRDLQPLPQVRGNAAHISQVVMNLVSNAIDAIPGRGTVVVRSASKGDEIVVEVEDDGAGIPPEIAGKIFDPFFTTKEVGKGMGLGLSISFNIVKAHGGTLAVESAPGRTLFRMVIPRGSPR